MNYIFKKEIENDNTILDKIQQLAIQNKTFFSSFLLDKIHQLTKIKLSFPVFYWTKYNSYSQINFLFPFSMSPHEDYHNIDKSRFLLNSMKAVFFRVSSQ